MFSTQKLYDISEFDTYKSMDGAFRFGTIWLMVPPLSIHFSNIKGNEVSWTMRQQGPSFNKTGRGMISFDVDLVFSGRHAIEKQLAPILAMIRRNPIQMVANKTLAKLLSYDDNKKLPCIPIAVTHYALNTMQDLPDTLILNLSCMVFNIKPYTRRPMFLRAEFVKEDPEYPGYPILNFIPTSNPENSNLYIDFYNSLIKPWNKVNGFMFAGEGLDSQETPGWFSGRFGNREKQIVKNGTCIRLPDTRGDFVGSNMTIGYHTWGIDIALDTNLGAYLSNRSGKWVETEGEAKQDIIEWLGIKDDTEKHRSLKNLIKGYSDLLTALPASNVGGKYVKKFHINTDSIKQIVSQSIQRSLPISVLPTLSSHIPTIQYLGGAESSLQVSIVTQNEEWLQILKAVDATIEASARDLHRKYGWESTYIESDIPNINGTFNVVWGDIDVQSVEDNPGTYIVNIKFQEQGEIVNVLNTPPTQDKKLKRKLLDAIINEYAQTGKLWTYDASVDKRTKKYTYGHDWNSTSYIRAIIIPDIIRVIRDEYIKYLKNTYYGKGSCFQIWPATIGFFQSNTDSEYITRNLMMQNAATATQVALLDPTTFAAHLIEKGLNSAGFIDSTKGITEYERVENAYNAIWRAIVGAPPLEQGAIFGGVSPEVYNSLGLKAQMMMLICENDANELAAWQGAVGYSEKGYFAAFRRWLRDNPPVDLLMRHFVGRLDYLIRSPHLLLWELDRMKHIDASERADLKTQLCPQKNPTKQTFRLEYYLSNYPDMGMPYQYYPRDIHGNKLSKLPYIFMSPTFYMQKNSVLAEQGPADDEQLKNTSEIKTQINSISKKVLDDRVSRKKALGHYLYGGFNPNSTSSNDGLRTLTRVPSELIVQDAKEKQKMDEYQQRLKDIEATRTNYNVKYQSSTIQTLGSSDMVNYNASLNDSSSYSNETSRQAITEHIREGRLWRATFKDHNPNIEQDLQNIIKKGYDAIYNDAEYYSLDKAFPTYKLYFRIENKPEWFLFDQFFDFKGADSIKYYKDKAAPGSVLYITLNNHNNCLSDIAALSAHRSFAAGDLNTSDQIKVWATAAADNSQTRGGNTRPGDLFEKSIWGKPASSKQTDIEYLKQTVPTSIRKLFVRAGTQLQLKLGYKPGSEDLSTIFNGYISDVSYADDQIMIVAHSYGAELLTDANVGWLVGRALPPKALIWKLLANSNIKHLGRFLGASITPDGSFLGNFEVSSFDDNIYIDELTQEGFAAILQAYNADNMTVWDVLQDIAAAHPGYICATVPYDNRETIFFGRPDSLYQFTHDLGVSRKLTKEEQGYGSIGGAPKLQLPEGEINQLQWLRIKQQSEEMITTQMIKRCQELVNANTSRLETEFYMYAMKYCQYVEILMNLACDPSSGNMEYALGEVVGGEPSPSSEQSVGTTNVGHVHNRLDGGMRKFAPLGEGIKAYNDLYDIYFRVTAFMSTSMDYGVAEQMKYYWNQSEKAKKRMDEALSRVATGGDADKNIPDKDTDGPVGALLKSVDNTLYAPILKLGEEAYARWGIDSVFVAVAWSQVAMALQNMNVLLGKIVPSQPKDENDNALNPILLGKYYENVTIPGRGVLTNSIFKFTQEDWSAINSNTIDLGTWLRKTCLQAHAYLRSMLLNKLGFNGSEYQFLSLAGHAPNKKYFRQYHLLNGFENIISNNIKTSFQTMWNRVRVKYERHNATLMNIYLPAFVKLDLPFVLPFTAANSDFTIKAGNTLGNEISRELTTSVENAKTVVQARHYATSYLGEGIRNMYAGSLTILGNPDIKPYDIAYIYDDYNGMAGPVEVKSVTHLMSAETGFITVIEPHAKVDVLGIGDSPTAIIGTLFDVASLVPLFSLLRPVKAVKGLGWLVKGVSKIKANPSQFMKKDLPDAWSKLTKTTSDYYDNFKAWGTKQGEAVNAAIAKGIRTDIFGDTEKANKFAKSLGIDNADLLKRRLVYISNRKLRKSGNRIAQTTIDKKFAEMSPTALQNNIEKLANKVKYDKLTPEQQKAFDEALASIDNIKLSEAGDILSNIVDTHTKKIKDKLSWVGLAGNYKLLKLLMIGSTLGTYEFMIGRDDPNYACPVLITPLSKYGEPFTAGLDGINRDGDLFHIIENEVLRMKCSLDTIGQFANFIGSVTRDAVS
jgi:hypothetical protein